MNAIADRLPRKWLQFVTEFGSNCLNYHIIQLHRPLQILMSSLCDKSILRTHLKSCVANMCLLDVNSQPSWFHIQHLPGSDHNFLQFVGIDDVFMFTLLPVSYPVYHAM